MIMSGYLIKKSISLSQSFKTVKSFSERSLIGVSATSKGFLRSLFQNYTVRCIAKLLELF